MALYRNAEAKMRAVAEAEIDAIERGLAPAVPVAQALSA